MAGKFTYSYTGEIKVYGNLCAISKNMFGVSKTYLMAKRTTLKEKRPQLDGEEYQDFLNSNGYPLHSSCGRELIRNEENINRYISLRDIIEKNGGQLPTEREFNQIFEISKDKKDSVNIYQQFIDKVKEKENRLMPKRRKGDITSFSKKSRLRLMYQVNKVDFKKRGMPYFITLTYPKRYPTDGEEYKSDLDVFLKRLKSQFGKLEYIWRLEAQRRGAPHYHLIIYFSKEIKVEYLRHWVSTNWFEVAQRKWEEKLIEHLKAGTNCKLVNNYRQLISYVSKYMSKNQGDNLIHQGRYWGTSRNWGDLIQTIEIGSEHLFKFLRLIRRYLERTNKKFSKKVVSLQTINVFASWEFIFKALEWSESG